MAAAVESIQQTRITRPITNEIYNLQVVRDNHGLHLEGGWRPSVLGAPDLDSRSYHVAKDFLFHRMTQQEEGWPSELEMPSDQPDEFCLAMRRMADSMEERYQDAFDEMADFLQISPSALYTSFMGVADELFQEGFNYGRLFAFYCFFSSLAIRCCRFRYSHLIGHLLEWMSAYVDQNLQAQMNQLGGWDGFVMFSKKQDKASFSSWAMGAVGVGCVGLGLGAVLSKLSS